MVNKHRLVKSPLRVNGLLQRNKKRDLLINFLASGEIWTTTTVAARLLGIGKLPTRIMLRWLVEMNLLKVEKNAVPYSKQHIWGISARGLAAAEIKLLGCPEFSAVKTYSQIIEDHIDFQLIRLDLERMGWSSFVRGDLLTQNGIHPKNESIYAALATRDDGLRVAIVIERYVKSLYRIKAEIKRHLSKLHGEKYNLVYFFTPNKMVIEQAVNEVVAIHAEGKGGEFRTALREKFIIIDIQQFRDPTQEKSLIPLHGAHLGQSVLKS